jgi:hypothetical protein
MGRRLEVVMDNTELIAEAKEFAKIKDGEYPEYEDELEHIILGLCSALEQVEAEREGKVLVNADTLKELQEAQKRLRYLDRLLETQTHGSTIEVGTIFKEFIK